MITVNEKLYITKEVNQIVLHYAKTVVLRNFLLEFTFEKNSDNKDITARAEEASLCRGDLSDDVVLEIIHFIYPYLQKLDKKATTALYFWTIDNQYQKYIDELDDDTKVDLDTNDADEVYNFEFGRMLAHKLYEPESTELDDDLIKDLKHFLESYLAEVDLSLIEEYTLEHINETIDNYCL